jgi:uncharacterized protein YlbG (UPF0298 family)
MTLTQLLKKFKLGYHVEKLDEDSDFNVLYVNANDLDKMLNQLAVNFEFRNKPRCPHCSKFLIPSDCEMIQILLLKIRNKIMR